MTPQLSSAAGLCVCGLGNRKSATHGGSIDACGPHSAALDAWGWWWCHTHVCVGGRAGGGLDRSKKLALLPFIFCTLLEGTFQRIIASGEAVEQAKKGWIKAVTPVDVVPGFDGRNHVVWSGTAAAAVRTNRKRGGRDPLRLRLVRCSTPARCSDGPCERGGPIVAMAAQTKLCR